MYLKIRVQTQHTVIANPHLCDLLLHPELINAFGPRNHSEGQGKPINEDLFLGKELDMQNTIS